MSLAFDICTLLVSKGVSPAFGGTLDWSSRAENEPSPDANNPILCLTVYQSQSIPINTLPETVGFFYTFQVRTRGTTYVEAATQANLINSAIGFLLRETINTNEYRNIMANSAPIKIETDQKNRVIFVQNFSAKCSC